MATYYVDSAAANDNGAGTEGDPWKYIPGMSSANGAHTLADGDTVNVKNGSVFTQRVATASGAAVPNVLCRGYGIGGTDIEITYPANIADISALTTLTLARQAGTHEGSWQIDRSGDSTGRSGSTGVCIYVDQPGWVFQDVEVIGNKAATGNSTNRTDTVLIESGGTECTFERFAIVGSTFEAGSGSSTSGRALRIRGKDTTLRYGKVTWSSGDCVYVQGQTANDLFDASTFTMFAVEIGGANTGYPNAPIVNRAGDGLQIAPVSEGDDRGVFRGVIDFQQCYFWSHQTNKQALVLQDNRAGAVVSYCNFTGINGGNAMILLNIVNGPLTIDHCWFADPSRTLAVIRQTVPDNWGGVGDAAQPQFIVGPDAVLTISNNTITGDAGPLYQNTATNTTHQDPSETLTFEGSLVISGNRHLSPDVSGETDAANGNATGVLLWGAASTTLFTDTASVSIDSNEWWAYRVTNGSSATATPTLVLPPCIYGGSLGSELITNGTFASDTGWTKGTGWTIGSGVATKAAGTASNLTNTGLSLAVGAYKVVVTVTRTAGTLTLYCAGSTHSITASGTYTFWRKREGSSTAFRFEADADFAGTVDDVSCKLATPQSILNNADWTVTDNYFRRDPPDGSTANSSRIQLGESGDVETGFGVTTYQETVGGDTGIEKFEAAHSAATGNYETVGGGSGGDGGTTTLQAVARWVFM